MPGGTFNCDRMEKLKAKMAVFRCCNFAWKYANKLISKTTKSSRDCRQKMYSVRSSFSLRLNSAKNYK